MSIEQSPFWYDSNDLANTIFATKDNVTIDEFLMNYYSTSIPASSSTDVSKDHRYVTFIESTRDTYSSRAQDIEDLYKGFDSNVSYKLFEELVFDAEGNVKAGITIEKDILDSIKEMISTKRAQATQSEDDVNEEAWTSYVQLLHLQDAQKAAKQLDETYINLYVENYK